MRRRQEDRVDAGIGEDGVQIAGQLQMMLSAKIFCGFEVGLCGTDDRQPFVAERGLDETAAPAAEAGDCSADHLITSDETGCRRIPSINATLASIRPPDDAVPMKPNPMMPADTYHCMISSPFPLSRIFCFNANDLGIRRPSRELSADKATHMCRRVS